MMKETIIHLTNYSETSFKLSGEVATNWRKDVPFAVGGSPKRIAKGMFADLIVAPSKRLPQSNRWLDGERRNGFPGGEGTEPAFRRDPSYRHFFDLLSQVLSFCLCDTCTKLNVFFLAYLYFEFCFVHSEK